MNDLNLSIQLLHKILPSCNKNLPELYTILETNQNADLADGSFTEQQWTALRDIIVALQIIIKNSTALDESLKQDIPNKYLYW